MINEAPASATVRVPPDRDAARRRQCAETRALIHESAAFTTPFLVMNTLATVVACYGLLSDSTAVVIGAMIIAMLLGPITGIALALVDGDAALLRKALLAEVGGALLVLTLSFAIGLLHREIPLTHEMLSRTKPNLLDLMIALAGGAAGAYAMVSPRLSVGLVGVAIATALLPPLATCGICLARHQPSLAWGGFLLFFTNLVAIQFASSVVMWLSGFHDVTDQGEARKQRHKRLLLTNVVSNAVLVLLTVLMASNFAQSLGQQTFQTNVRKRLVKSLLAYPGVHLADVNFTSSDDIESISATIRTPYSFSPERVGALEKALPQLSGKKVALKVISVLVKETTPTGYLNAPAEPTPSPASGNSDTTSADTSDNTIFGR
jgi:uncharacterized hydrophobic protein (TIGR00271 family)